MTNLPNNLDTFQRVNNNTRSENAHTDLHNSLAETLEAVQKYSGSNIVLELPATSEVNRVYTLKQTHQGRRPGIYVCTQADPAEYLNVGGVQPKANGGLRFDGQELEVESTDGTNMDPQAAGYLIGGTGHSPLSVFQSLILKISQTIANVADSNDYLASIKKGQSFTTGSSGYINEFKLFLSRNNGANTQIPVYIYAVDANGLPTGSPLFTGSFNFVNVGTTPTWIVLSCSLQLSPNTKYALVINMPGYGSSYWLRWNGTDSGYPGGDWLYFDGTTWTKNSDKARAFIVTSGDDNDGKIKINVDGTVYDDVLVDLYNLYNGEITEVFQNGSGHYEYKVLDNAGVGLFTSPTTVKLTSIIILREFNNNAATLSIRDANGNTIASSSSRDYISGEIRYNFTGVNQIILENDVEYKLYGTGSNYASVDANGNVNFKLSGYEVNVDNIAITVQTAIRAATGKTEIVVYDTDHFVITSSTKNRDSKILKLMSPTTGTDISGAGAIPYLDCAANANEIQGLGEEYRLVKLDENGLISDKMIPLNTVSLVAGENVASKKVVAVTALTSSGQTESPSGSGSGATDSFSNNRKFSTYFTTPNQGIPGTMKLTTFSMPMSASGGTLTGTMFSELFLAGVDNLPTGSALYTSNTISAGAGNMTFTNAIVDKNTKYCVVTTITSSSNNSRFQYINGSNPVFSTWEWNGTAWVGVSTLHRLVSTTWDVTKEGEVSLATSVSDNQLANNVIGFTTEAKNAGESVKIQINGIVSGLSGLTTGSTYYLGTAGEISASAGLQSRKLGLAISTTQLLIIRDNA